ncbi:MAG: serine/threonine-protein kinase [Luteolibacter sp.]
MSDSQEYTNFIAPEPADLAPFFPGYEIQNLIATGGMGAVYCAVQKSLDRTVALKILPQELSKDAAFCAGFEAEAKAMARLNHPNLIGVYDFGEVNGMLYIIMEFVPGNSIYHSADGIAIDPGEVIRLVTGICHGLAHAHENGILHRDIKPSNILLDLNAQPKIGDFGLARPFDRKIEEGEEIFGTPHYTAPEVVENPHSVDYRADIFSVGVLLHELLTGKLPANDPRPASLISRCDTRFDAIIRRATQPSPAARYASAAEMADELQALAKPSAVQVPKAVAVSRPVAPRRVATKTKKASSGGSPVFLLLLIGAAGAAAYWYFYKKPSVVIVVEPPAAELVAPPAAETVTPPEPEPMVEEALTPPPVVTAEPVPEVEMTPEAAPDVAATPPPVAAPKYDVAGFLARGRAAMKDRAKPLIAGYQEKLKDNVTSLERELERTLRKMHYTRESSEQIIATDIAEWRRAGNRLPARVGRGLAGYPGVFKSFSDHVEDQTALDSEFDSEMAKLGSVYVDGIGRQMEKLRAASDGAAADLIEKEIESVKKSPEYFSDLMGASAVTGKR